MTFLLGARRTDIETFFAPEADLDLRDASSSSAAMPSSWEFPILYPIDLTETHGWDITLDRLQEIASTYDPAVEMASLNLDHCWSGPSLGWCEAAELRGQELWVRYVDLAPEAVELVRARKYTRRSAEIVFKHKATGGWYLSGVALLGQARPAVPNLPPLQLQAARRTTTFFLKEASMAPLPPVEEKPAPPPPPTPVVPPPPPFLSPEEGLALASRVGQLETTISTQSLELAAHRVGQRLDQLGARVTPAFRTAVEPLLIALSATPRTIRLSGSPQDVDVLGLLLDALGKLPVFAALGAGELADTDPPSSIVPVVGALSADRLAQLEARFGFSKAHGS